MEDYSVETGIQHAISLPVRMVKAISAHLWKQDQTQILFSQLAVF